MQGFEAIKARAERAWAALGNGSKPRVIISLGSCGLAAGAAQTREALQREVQQRGIDVSLGIAGCWGMCYAEPVVEVVGPAGIRVVYGGVTAEQVPRLVEETLEVGGICADLALGVVDETPRNGLSPLFAQPFFACQARWLLARCGQIDPEDIDQAIVHGAYAALNKVLRELSPVQVIAQVAAAGLCGRGGAYFPTGRKWHFLRMAGGMPKYMVCNADEGDPGAYVDRTLMEGDPHLVLEGNIIGAYATGCSRGYIYVRAEYPLAARRLETALAQARERGLLGEHILGSDFSFDMELVVGGGSYIAGEETGLISSMEGLRAMPRVRPPYPAQAGLWGQPTNVNNVETLANVPLIFRYGAEWYAGVGHGRFRGTKLFSLSGHIRRFGVVEVPFGTSLRRVIEEAGGGPPDGHRLKAVQPGGPLGGVIPASMLDIPLACDSFEQMGALLGSGGLVAIDERACMVDLARLFQAFNDVENCARCSTCRIATKRLEVILGRIGDGRGQPDDVETIHLLEELLQNSNCALGHRAASPAISTMRFFMEEYEAHIRDKRCPAGVCLELIDYGIDAALCTRCGICQPACPANAISSNGRHRIIQEACIRCGVCREVCPVGAVAVVSPRGRAREPLPPSKRAEEIRPR